MGCCQSVKTKKLSVAENVLKEHLDADARALYNLIDKDGDGVISYDEIGLVLKNIGVEISEREASDFINTHDLDGDGYIDFKEFKKLLRMTMRKRSMDLIALFRFLDVDKDNRISFTEFIRGMDILGEKVTNQDVTSMMETYFHSKEDSINFEQFCTMFHRFV